jgi:endonuclease III
MTAAKQTQAARKQLLAKLHKALKAHYKPAAPVAGRPLLDQVLFACCLENADQEAAEKAFVRLVESYFDLNEIRVTTVAELSETLHDLPDPARAALALRRVLQSVFESTYSFSLDHAKKHSIAHGVKTLENLHGVPPFVVQHVASTALGAHLIPLDGGAIAGLYLAGIISQEEYDAGKVVGLERLIAKKAGHEFSALLHHFGADVTANLHGAAVRQVLQAVNPAAVKERFPKRGDAMRPPNPPPPAAGKEGRKATEAAQNAADVHRPAGPQAAARPAGKTPLPPPGAGPKRTADGTTAAGGKPGPKPFVVKPHAGKAITIKPRAEPPAQPEPVGGKPAASAAKREAPKPAAKKPAGAVKPPAPPKKPAPAAPRKPAAPPKAANGGKAAPAKSAETDKTPGRSHSARLKKSKPR